MNLVRDTSSGLFKLEMASLIDVVFLLLIYFMVTASLIKKEGDLGFMLPNADPVPQVDVPIELFIEIAADGVVRLEGMRFDRDDRALQTMTKQIDGLRQIAQSQGSKFYVNLQPHKKAKHGRIVDVMDACAKAKVENLGFAESI